MKDHEAESVIKGRVDIILENIASLNEKTKIADPQLKKIIGSLKKLGNKYYDPYAVAVMPSIDEKINPRKKT
jgi:hypothetical protein